MTVNKTAGLSLYLHIPFCKTHCTYCDFNIYTNLGFLFEAYVDALCAETERTLQAVQRGDYNPLAPLPPATELVSQTLNIETVFLGGGTPSLLPPAQIGKIMATIRRNGLILPNAEITLEANPGTLSSGALAELRQMGINRLSFGVQTFEDPALKKLGRAHTGQVAIEAFAQAREAGFTNISLDFMYGLPGQTLQSWEESLDKALALEPEHISMYGLIIEEKTWLGRRVLDGRIQVPEEEAFADMYELGVAKLAAAGLQQYEISNFAREGYASRHNLVYWHNTPYIGLGVGAHSCFGGYRYAVVKHPKDYIKRLNAGESVIDLEEVEQVTPALKLADTVILALRLNEGLSLSRVEREFGKPLTELYPGVVEKFINWGLLEETLNAAGDQILRLTMRGRLLSNNVFMEFLPS